MYQYLSSLSGYGAADEDDAIQQNDAIPADIDPSEFISPVDQEPSDQDEEAPIVRGEVTAARWMFPAALATQIFSIVPGVAGGLAGFVLASKLSNAKNVKASEVLLASGVVALITFMSVFLVRTIDEYDE